MRLDGFGLIIRDMGAMVRFYRDVLGFEVRECADTGNVYLIKDGILFLLRESGNAEPASRASGLAGHVETAFSSRARRLRWTRAEGCGEPLSVWNNAKKGDERRSVRPLCRMILSCQAGARFTNSSTCVRPDWAGIR